MTDRSEDCSRRDLDSSLESQFAALLDRHKEAVAKSEWSYDEFLPLETFRADARGQRPLSPTVYPAVERRC